MDELELKVIVEKLDFIIELLKAALEEDDSYSVDDL